jgi:hypothetical protein
LNLTTQYLDQPTVQLLHFPSQSLYPPLNSSSTLIQSPFPTSHRFSIPLTQTSPGTLDLNPRHGSITYTLQILLTLSSGEIITESIQVEGTPFSIENGVDTAEEVEKVLERKGVRTRVLVDTPRPRLGSLLRLGVEVQPIISTGGASSMDDKEPTDPRATLRPLRRVRVELFRQVRITLPQSTLPSIPSSSSTSTSTSPEAEGRQHLQLLYTSGKSLRYPGSTSHHPPLRVLFTMPTSNTSSSDQSWGEITQKSIYHDVGFFIRVSIGFGLGGGDGKGDWILEIPITIRKKRWMGYENLSDGSSEVDQEYMNEDALAREAYRRKGQDAVGSAGTYRIADGPSGSASVGDDLPPPFEAGPSGTAAIGDGGLPTFLESEEQIRGLSRGGRVRNRSVERNRATSVGRSGSLGGELASWVEVSSVYFAGLSIADTSSSVYSILDP